MDHEDVLAWKLNQILRVTNRAIDPWLGEALDAIQAIAGLSDEEVTDFVLNGEHFPLDERWFR